MNEDDDIRIPDESFSDRLIDEDNLQFNDGRINNEDYTDPYDMNKALEISMNEYAINQVTEHIVFERIEKERIEKEKETRKNILKQFNIRLNYFKNDSNLYIRQMSNYLEKQLEKFMECLIEHILLFKKHYELLNDLLRNLYEIPLSKGLKTRINEDSYLLIKNICRFL